MCYTAYKNSLCGISQAENEALCLPSGHKDFHQISIIGLNTLENMDPSFDTFKPATDQQTVRTRK